MQTKALSSQQLSYRAHPSSQRTDQQELEENKTTLQYIALNHALVISRRLYQLGSLYKEECLPSDVQNNLRLFDLYMYVH